MDVFNNPPINPDTLSHESPVRKKELLLFVEDDLVNQMLGRKMLAKGGYDVEVAATGHMALDMLKAKNYSLIITDIKLPNMTGYELAEKIRKSAGAPYADVPIIAVSAFPDSVAVEQAPKAGINKFLSKPFIIVDLLDSIRELLDISDARGPK